MNRPEGISHNDTKSDQSLQSEEGSFIVLGRSTSPNDVSLSQVLNGINSLNLTSVSQASQSGSNCLSSSIIVNDLSPEEIQSKIQALLQENVELKEVVKQNNLAMKQQFDTLVMWQEEVFKAHQNHKQKFEETKELILKLRTENAELRKALAEYESNQSSTVNDTESVAKLQSENKILKQKVSEAEARDKVVRLLEFQLKTENADLKGKVQELQKKLAALGDGSHGLPTTNALAAVTAEREELGGGGNLGQLEVTLPPAKKPHSPPPSSFVMVENRSRRSPCEGGSCKGHASEEALRQLEDTKRVLEVERHALEEDRKALEKGRRAMHARVMEIDEKRKQAEVENERLKDALAELTKQLEEERLSGKELMKLLEQSERDNRLTETGKWVVVSPPTEGVSPVQACESRLGLLRNYFSSQEQKFIKTDVWLQKVNQIIVSMMAIDPVKGKELKEEVALIRKQLLKDSDEMDQHKIYLIEAENLLTELKLGFDTLKAQAESVSTVEQESAKSNYHEAQARGFREKLDEVSARLSQAEEALSNSRTETTNLSEKLKEATVKMEEITILKAQVEVYQADFNTEREERSRMASDKQQLEEDVRRLRVQNQQLLEDLETLERRLGREENRGSPEGISSPPVSGFARPSQMHGKFTSPFKGPSKSFVKTAVMHGSTKMPTGNSFVGSSSRTTYNTLAAPGRMSSGMTSPRPQAGDSTRDRTSRGSSEPRAYSCPKCYKSFMEYGPLEVHVNECLDNP